MTFNNRLMLTRTIAYPFWLRINWTSGAVAVQLRRPVSPLTADTEWSSDGLAEAL